MILQIRELGLFLNSSKKIILDGRGVPSLLSSGLQIRVKSVCFLHTIETESVLFTSILLPFTN